MAKTKTNQHKTSNNQPKMNISRARMLQAIVDSVNKGTYAVTAVDTMVDENDNPIQGRAGLMFVPYGKKTLRFLVTWYNNKLSIISYDNCDNRYFFTKENGCWSGIAPVVGPGVDIYGTTIYTSVIKPIYHHLK